MFQPFIEEAITVAQLQDALEKRTIENKELKKDIVKLKEELHNVKTRNKKLCQILGQGESEFLLIYLIIIPFLFLYFLMLTAML